MYQNTMQTYSDDMALVTKYSPYGRNRYSAKEIPEITARVDRMQKELDFERRNAMIKQLAKDLAPLMFDLPTDYNQKPYLLHWPWLKNYDVFGTLGFTAEDNCSARLMTEHWYDPTQRS